MTIEDIENEIVEFCSLYFKDEIDIIEDNKIFLETNNLYQPKENYIVLYELLNTLLNQVKDIDYDTLGSVIFKLDRDMKFLYHSLTLLEKKTESFEDVFLKRMISKSTIFNLVQTQILDLKNLNNISNEQRILLKKYQNTLKQIYKIYYKVFYSIFFKQNALYQLELKKVLNTKIYYFDKLIWNDIEKSDSFRQRLRTLNHQKDLGSKAYISHKLEIVLPHCVEYKYLENCLKVFK